MQRKLIAMPGRRGSKPVGKRLFQRIIEEGPPTIEAKAQVTPIFPLKNKAPMRGARIAAPLRPMER
jgi:hypothetical protein